MHLLVIKRLTTICSLPNCWAFSLGSDFFKVVFALFNGWKVLTIDRIPFGFDLCRRSPSTGISSFSVSDINENGKSFALNYLFIRVLIHFFFEFEEKMTLLRLDGCIGCASSNRTLLYLVWMIIWNKTRWPSEMISSLISSLKPLRKWDEKEFLFLFLWLLFLSFSHCFISNRIEVTVFSFLVTLIVLLGHLF